MRRLLKAALTILLALLLVAVGVVGYLWVSSADPRVSENWNRLADLAEPRGEVAATVGSRVVDDCPREPCPMSPVRFVIAGGISGLGRVVERVDSYDPTSDVWAREPNLPEPRHHAAAAGAGGVVYLSGGARRTTRRNPERTFWSLDPNANSWSEAPAMPEPRMGHQMVTVGRRLYVIGGRGPTSNVLIFDTVASTWTVGAEMPGKRDHLAAVADGNRIYALGGRAGGLLDRVDVYDVESDVWRSGPALPEPMSAMVAGKLDDGVHVVGGEDPTTLTGGVIDRHYVLRNGTWEQAPLPIVGTHGAGGVALNGRLILAGGSRRQGALSPLGWTGITQAYTP